MSIQSEINRIAGAKSDIADAIEDMGGTISPGASIDDLAAGVRTIPQGGVSDYGNLTNKPQINGNTLASGNQTGASLGLVDAVTGKGLSTEDYTTAEKTELAGIGEAFTIGECPETIISVDTTACSSASGGNIASGTLDGPLTNPYATGMMLFEFNGNAERGLYFENYQIVGDPYTWDQFEYTAKYLGIKFQYSIRTGGGDPTAYSYSVRANGVVSASHFTLKSLSTTTSGHKVLNDRLTIDRTVIAGSPNPVDGNAVSKTLDKKLNVPNGTEEWASYMYYYAGDYCLHNNALYRRLTEGSDFSWVPANWELVDVVGEVTGKITAPASPSAGQYLLWNGSSWEASDLPSAPVQSVNGATGTVVLEASDVGAIEAPASPTTGSVLTYDGSGWSAQNTLDSIKALFLNAAYPVGAIYMSTSSTSPATLFGGTWDRITGRFLLAATDGGNSGASQAAGNNGGSANAVVVSHSHGMDSGGAHTHTITTYYTKDAASGSAKNRAAANASETSTSISKIVSNSGSHSHTIKSEGVSGTGANMPPYLSVYMWKRTA